MRFVNTRVILITSLVTQYSDNTIEADYNNILQSARNNKTVITVNKTSEIVFRRPRLGSINIQPSFYYNIEQVDGVLELNCWALHLTVKLSFGKHVSTLLT